jgi:hypothetical protein
MKSPITPAYALLLTSLLCTNSAFAVGVLDDNATLVGLNPNGNYIGGDEVRIKKASAGASGCTVVKFRPGFGNLPADANGIAARDRIYATALAAYLSDKPVSIWVWDTANCYGLMLVFTDTSAF